MSSHSRQKNAQNKTNYDGSNERCKKGGDMHTNEREKSVTLIFNSLS